MFGWFKRQPKLVIDHEKIERDFAYSRGKPTVEECPMPVEFDPDQNLRDIEAKFDKMEKDTYAIVYADSSIPADQKERVAREAFLVVLEEDKKRSDIEFNMYQDAVLADQRHDELLQAINGVRQEVARGNVLADIIDVAKANPFLTSVVLTHLHGKLTSK